MNPLTELEDVKGTNTSMITIATKNIQATLSMMKYEISITSNIKSRV
jgi:peptide subunit release factor 1 (eRF1)